MPLLFNEKMEPKKCLACHEDTSYLQFAETEPKDTYVKISIVKAQNRKLVKELGYGFAQIWTCENCGHIDFYTWVTRDLST